LAGAIAEVDRLSPAFAEMEKLGMTPNFIVRLRSEQDVLRKCLYRIYYVQKMQFLPSVHVLIQTLVVATIFLLLFLQTEGSPGSAFVFGFVSYMFVYALHLISRRTRSTTSASSCCANSWTRWVTPRVRNCNTRPWKPRVRFRSCSRARARASQAGGVSIFTGGPSIATEACCGPGGSSTTSSSTRRRASPQLISTFRGLWPGVTFPCPESLSQAVD
jgi:hypothetical protein